MQANPLLQVQIKLTTKQMQAWAELLQLLLKAGVIEHADEHNTILLNPPKGTVSNASWAEKVYKHCLEQRPFAYPALIVRPERSAQEVAS